MRRLKNFKNASKTRCGTSLIKFLSLIATIFLLSCDDIPRDNLLDPKNPDSIRRQKVLVEAFVNTNNDQEFNEYALEALQTLKNEHGSNLVILEYHRHTMAFNDPYHLPENETLYEKYIAEFNNMKGVPDIFINGSEARIQGASSVSNSIARISPTLTGPLRNNSFFTVEIDYDIEGNQVIPRISVARLGTKDALDFIVKTVLIAQIDQDFLQRVVRDMSSLAIQRLEHGTFTTYALDPLTIKEPQAPLALVAYVTDEDETTVFQCDSVAVGKE